ncbi:MAG: HlyD family type I secretion periplasmic adaptor subunit [Desulfovibrionaceae bacterium]|nr:HlyD family type I secretion periplasmic adaptor subunit [Desulfovibrionaceae bacterium]
MQDQNAAKLAAFKTAMEKSKPSPPEQAPHKEKGNLLHGHQISALDMEFMSEADAAILRKGNPRTYILSLAVVLLFVVVVIWAWLTRLDEVTKASGQVVPAQAIQEIQYLEGGVLENLMVRQGDDVEEGQVLARISNAMAESALQEQKDSQAAIEADIIRLRAERAGQEPLYPDAMAAMYPNLINGQMELFRAHLEQRDTELRTLEAELEQRRIEVRESEERLKSIKQNLKVATERRDMVKPLVERGIHSRSDYLTLEQSVISLNGELNSTTQVVSRGNSAVTAAEERVNSRRQEWQSSLQEEINQKSAALNSISILLSGRSDTVQRTDLRSPVRGKVKRILINTLGGTVSPGATIMEILPSDEKLLIEAKVGPADRAFLHTADDPEKKQRAVVKVSAYDFSIYGGLDATLESISDDTFEDHRGDIYYQVRLLTTHNSISHKGKDYEILPGMVAQVDIITGKKTVLDYLLKPIFKARQNALRER